MGAPGGRDFATTWTTKMAESGSLRTRLSYPSIKTTAIPRTSERLVGLRPSSTSIWAWEPANSPCSKILSAIGSWILGHWQRKTFQAFTHSRNRLGHYCPGSRWVARPGPIQAAISGCSAARDTIQRHRKITLSSMTSGSGSGGYDTHINGDIAGTFTGNGFGKAALASETRAVFTALRESQRPDARPARHRVRHPGRPLGAATATDPAGNVWLFGGQGYDSAGKVGLLNDLWQYNPTTKQWTWIGPLIPT